MLFLNPGQNNLFLPPLDTKVESAKTESDNQTHKLIDWKVILDAFQRETKARDNIWTIAKRIMMFVNLNLKKNGIKDAQLSSCFSKKKGHFNKRQLSTMKAHINKLILNSKRFDKHWTAEEDKQLIEMVFQACKKGQPKRWGLILKQGGKIKEKKFSKTTEASQARFYLLCQRSLDTRLTTSRTSLSPEESLNPVDNKGDVFFFNDIFQEVPLELSFNGDKDLLPPESTSTDVVMPNLPLTPLLSLADSKIDDEEKIDVENWINLILAT